MENSKIVQDLRARKLLAEKGCLQPGHRKVDPRSLENPKLHSVLRIATTINPFLGGDEVALDVQMHAAVGSGNGLADYLFYFFFSPPRDCLDGGSEAYKKAKNQAELPDRAEVSADLSIRIDCKHPPTLAGFRSSI